MKSKAKRPAKLPARFRPRFWDDADQRQSVIREVKRRYDLLKEHTGATSFQKDLLAQRAIFLALQIESMEVAAAEEGNFDSGRYPLRIRAGRGSLS